VRAYHERTKHRWKAYAPGPETLDWESQPAPFRHFAGAPDVLLPRAADEAIASRLSRPFSAVSQRAIPLAPTLASLGAFLHLSLGITAWKSLGPDRWAVRANPSSGNLHPVEAYLILCGLPGLSAGVYHYRAEDHALECRAQFADEKRPLPAVCVALSTVGWREAWKYGERAFRYCQLDTGHAIAALQRAGAVLGWRVLEQTQVGTETLARVLGLDRLQDFPARRHPDTEREEAESLLTVDCDGTTPAPVHARHLRLIAAGARWNGVASTIDAHPMYHWPILNDIAAATRVTDGDTVAGLEPVPAGTNDATAASQSSASTADVLLGRRSAQRFDLRFLLERSDFFGVLEAVMPRTVARQGALGHTHAIDLVLLVHRVSGLDSGLYLLTRRQDGTASLAEALSYHFDLVPVAGAPPDVDLRCIALIESRRLARFARGLHCHQDIAAQACFALGMVAEFDSVIERDPASYRTLHREAGQLAHMLYLEAEARSLRGTAIGCFFDDMLHETLKFSDTRFQSLYHFAVGRPIEDPRIETMATRYLGKEQE
jgi:SagB-type dehydrogenase family enzyme